MNCFLTLKGYDRNKALMQNPALCKALSMTGRNVTCLLPICSTLRSGGCAGSRTPSSPPRAKCIGLLEESLSSSSVYLLGGGGGQAKEGAEILTYSYISLFSFSSQSTWLLVI